MLLNATSALVGIHADRLLLAPLLPAYYVAQCVVLTLRHHTEVCPHADDALTQPRTICQQIRHGGSPYACVATDKCSVL